MIKHPIKLFLIFSLVACQSESELNDLNISDPKSITIDGGGVGTGGSGGSTGGGSSSSGKPTLDNINFGIYGYSGRYRIPESPVNCYDLMSLAKYYAPIVKFASQEDDYPSSIDWFLSKVSLVVSGAVSYNSFQPNKNYVNRDNLSKYHASGKDFLGNSFDVYSGKWNGNSFRMKWKQNENVRHGNLNSAKTYVFIDERLKNECTSEKFIYIQYWFFYPYNDNTPGLFGHKGGWHDGDWEHITIVIDKSTCEIYKVNFEAHGNPQWRSPSKVLFYGSHPIVFSADNSHAFYPKADHYKTHWSGIVDKTSHGIWWKTENYLELANDKVNNIQEPWVKYKGKWGLSGDRTFSQFGFVANPPSGPRFSNDNYLNDIKSGCPTGFRCEGSRCVPITSQNDLNEINDDFK